MRKTVVSALTAIVACVSLTGPSFAATTNSKQGGIQLRPDERIVAQGPGYILTTTTLSKEQFAKTYGPQFTGNSQVSSSALQPMTTTPGTLTYNTTNNFTWATTMNYSDGQLAENSQINMTYNHSNVNPDVVNVNNGQFFVYWNGNNPTNATKIYQQPTETYYANAATFSSGLPAGVSISPNSTTQEAQWTTTEIDNNYTGTYHLYPYSESTDGHFTQIVCSDTATWMFGTSTYPEINTENINISLG